MTSDDILGVVTVLFYLLAVPLGIGAFTHGAVGLAVLAVLAIPLLAIALFAIAVVASLAASVRTPRVV